MSENKIENTVVLTQFVIRDADGNVDMVATGAKFEQALTLWDQHYRADLESTLAAIAEVYNQNKTDVLNAEYVVNQAAFRLSGAGSGPDAFKLVTERIREVLKSSGQFEASKGRNGGTKFLKADHKRAEKTDEKAA